MQQEAELVQSTMTKQVTVCLDLRIHVYTPFSVCKHCAYIQSLAVCSGDVFYSSLLTRIPMHMQVARQGSMAEQQMHQQQLKALHDDLQAVRVNTFRLACLFCLFLCTLQQGACLYRHGCCRILKQQLAIITFHKLHPDTLVYLSPCKALDCGP